MRETARYRAIPGAFFANVVQDLVFGFSPRSLRSLR
jgi:hypothetical protein